MDDPNSVQDTTESSFDLLKTLKVCNVGVHPTKNSSTGLGLHWNVNGMCLSIGQTGTERDGNLQFRVACLFVRVRESSQSSTKIAAQIAFRGAGMRRRIGRVAKRDHLMLACWARGCQWCLHGGLRRMLQLCLHVWLLRRRRRRRSSRLLCLRGWRRVGRDVLGPG